MEKLCLITNKIYYLKMDQDCVFSQRRFSDKKRAVNAVAIKCSVSCFISIEYQHFLNIFNQIKRILLY